jgi:hypothetical protein
VSREAVLDVAVGRVTRAHAPGTGV